MTTTEPQPNPTSGQATQGSAPAAAVAPPQWTWKDHLFDPDRAIGGYSGVAHTLPSTVEIKGPEGDLTVRGFDWIGKPFDNPIYYGARVWRWNPGGWFGTMIDVNHAKAIAKKDSIATFTGSHNGRPLPEKAMIRDVFNHFEFSNGHNMVTLNGLVRLGSLFGRLRPYAGLGAGVALPHTELGFKGDAARTYKYQYAGFTGQAVAGVELDLGRTSLIFEYKFTYAPIDVPLSHAPKSSTLLTDLWTQVVRWRAGERPLGGRMTVNLLTHHGVVGVMVKTGRAGSYVRP